MAGSEHGIKSAPARNARTSRRIFTPGRVFGGAACLLGGFIILNAVAMQTERHPAPLFKQVVKAKEPFPVPPLKPETTGIKNAMFESKPISGGRQAPAEKPKGGQPALAAPAPAEASDALLTEIQRELAKRGHFKGEPTGKPGPATTQAIRDFRFAQRLAVDGKPSEALLREVVASKVTMKEELLDLVKRTTQEDKSTKTVLDVQRALNKAGYGPVSEDGQMGPATRTALAKFEQDKKLPPKGELKGPVLRALASASGIAINP